MKAAFLSPNGFEIREIAPPKAGPDEVLVETVACGICEGDVFQYRTRATKNPAGELIGHEGSGMVRAVGKNVHGFAVGDPVTADGGTYAAYFTALPQALVKLPAAVSPKVALGEPVACFVHASGRFGIKPGCRVALIGCGYMGIGCLQMAALQGASEIVVLEPLAWRRQVAAAHGAARVYDPADQSPAAILADLGEFDVVIEATGVASVVDVCTALVKQHGRIVLVGYHQSNGGLRTVDMKTWNYKAINVMNGHVRRENEKVAAMGEGMALLAAGKLDFSGMIAYYPLERIEDAFHDLIARKEGLFKAAITF